MAEEIQPFVAALTEIGIELRPIGLPIDGFPAGLIYAAIAKGEFLHAKRAFVRASADVCRILAWTPFPAGIESVTKRNFAESLLQLNFQTAFGRISVGPDLQAGSETRHWIYVETAFFWRYVEWCPELFREEMLQRLQGFTRLVEQVKDLVDSVEVEQPKSD
jgi:hypothetical protein